MTATFENIGTVQDLLIAVKYFAEQYGAASVCVEQPTNAMTEPTKRGSLARVEMDFDQLELIIKCYEPKSYNSDR